MLLSCTVTNTDVGTYEKLVTITTASGDPKEVIVHINSLHNTKMMVAAVARECDRVLVELPREAVTGEWRLWVPATATQG